MENIRDTGGCDADVLESTNRYTYSSFLLRSVSNWLHKGAAQWENPSGPVLDLCCGMGNHFPFSRGSSYIGIDSSERWLAIAKQSFPKGDFRKADATKLPLEDRSIQTIVSLSAFEHLLDLGEVLTECHRVLKPSGDLVIGVPTEGFIYRLGRFVTTKRRLEKMFPGLDYLELCEREHRNDIDTIKRHAVGRFNIGKTMWIPFGVPFSDLNVWILLQCSPLKR